MINNLDYIYKELFTLINPSNREEEILKTINDTQFPGAIIPIKNSYYIIAFSQKEFKVIFSLINSFIGKNYSNFQGHIISLNKKIEIEGRLKKYNITLASKFDVNEVSKDVTDALIIKMIQVYKSSNKDINSIVLSIGKLIDNFKESIYITKDINNAQNIIKKIKQEYRLDALNINFMEIELAHAFQKWDDIINHKLILQIIYARKPLLVRLHIIEAFFYSYLFNSSNIEKDYISYIKPNILHLLTYCPSNVVKEIKYMYLISYSFGDISYSNINLIITDYLKNPFLSEKEKEIIKEKLSNEKIRIEDKNDNLFLSTKASIIEANNVDTLDKINNVTRKLEKLKIEEQKELNPKILSREIDEKSDYFPKNWIEWIDLLSDKLFKESFLVAEKGLEEWNIDLLITDFINIITLCKRINALDEQYSLSKFITALPLFIESLKRSESYPNKSCLEIYKSILEVISKYEIQDQKTLILTQDIFESIAEII